MDRRSEPSISAPGAGCGGRRVPRSALSRGPRRAH